MSAQVCPATPLRTVIIPYTFPTGSFTWIWKESLSESSPPSGTVPRYLRPPALPSSIEQSYTMTRENVQRNISPFVGAIPPPDCGGSGPASLPAPHQQRQYQPSLQIAIFRAFAPLLVFAIRVAGLLIESRAHQVDWLSYASHKRLSALPCVS